MPYPRHVTDISQLHPGDHIYWDRGGYQHHAIVETVNPHNQQILVVHYSGEVNKKGMIQRNWVPLWQPRSSSMSHVNVSSLSAPVPMHDPLYVVIHNEIPYPNSPAAGEVIARAHSRVGETSYDLAANNCESFANWCKIGKNKSFQAEIGIGITVGVCAAVLAAALGTLLAPKRG